jgi:hypothetical protein
MLAALAERAVDLGTLIFAGIAALTGVLVWRVERARDRRRDLIVEVAMPASADPSAFRTCQITLRNQERVAVRLLGFRTTARGALLLHPRFASRDDGLTSQAPGGPPQMDKAGPRIDYALTIRPAGTEGGIGHAGDTACCTVLVLGPCREDQIKVDWRWADGKRR